MNWTKNKPTKEGFYWVQRDFNTDPLIVWATEGDDGIFVCLGPGEELYESVEDYYLWAGPLEPPCNLKGEKNVQQNDRNI